MNEFETKMLELQQRQTRAAERLADEAEVGALRESRRPQGFWARSEAFLKGVKKFTDSGM